MSRFYEGDWGRAAKMLEELFNHLTANHRDIGVPQVIADYTARHDLALWSHASAWRSPCRTLWTEMPVRAAISSAVIPA